MNIPGISGVMGIADQFIALLRKFSPHNWQGSHNKKRLDSITHMDGGVNIANQRVWAKAVFVEGGITHRLLMSQAIADVGQSGKPTHLEYDQIDVSAMEAGFVLSHREGLFGVRLVGEFKFTADGSTGLPIASEHRFRFDGDLL